MPERTTASQAQVPFNAEGCDDEEGRASQDKHAASRERAHDGALGVRRCEGTQTGLSCERYKPIHVRRVCDLTASAIRIFLHAFATSAMAAEAIGKPARPMGTLSFRDQATDGSIIQNNGPLHRPLHRRMAVSTGRRTGGSENQVAVRIDDVS